MLSQKTTKFLWLYDAPNDKQKIRWDQMTLALPIAEGADTSARIIKRLAVRALEGEFDHLPATSASGPNWKADIVYDPSGRPKTLRLDAGYGCIQAVLTRLRNSGFKVSGHSRGVLRAGHFLDIHL